MLQTHSALHYLLALQIGMAMVELSIPRSQAPNVRNVKVIPVFFKGKIKANVVYIFFLFGKPCSEYENHENVYTTVLPWLTYNLG